MAIVIDVQEKEGILKAIDGAEFTSLYHANSRRSYDYRVTTLAGQVLRIERKSCADAVGSFTMAPTETAPGCCRLCTQARSVDLLVIEWTETDAASVRSHLNKPELVESTKKHLWRLSLEMPVLWTTGPLDTIRLLKYLESKKEVLAVRSSSSYPATDLPSPVGASGQHSSQDRSSGTGVA